MRLARHLVLAVALLIGARAAAEEAGPVVEQHVQLPVTIAGATVRLDTLIVRKPGDQRLPVALITHGASQDGPRAATLDWLRGWAHDMANRGWLAAAVMRRGYGGSEGELVENAGSCAMPDVGRYLDTQADDLEAALHALVARPDADANTVIAIGDSSGGATVLDLAARAGAHLTAAVNVSGGLGHRDRTFERGADCDTFDSDLVWNFARFGARTRIPTLWLYAENDGWFRPGLVARLRAAYLGSQQDRTGAEAELVMLPPFGKDGHTMFFAAWGRGALVTELDRFLRAHDLPSWSPAPFAPLLARLSPADRTGVAAYLRQPTEKALALGAGGGIYWAMGEADADVARRSALAFCRSKTHAACTIAATDFEPAAAAPKPAAEPAH